MYEGGGFGAHTPCSLGAMTEAEAYAEAEKVIAARPQEEAPWVIRHWPWVLVGMSAVAAGLIYVGTRRD